MNAVLENKIRDAFSQMAIYKDPVVSNNLFAGRNLPSFVKDFILKKYLRDDGSVDKDALTNFLNLVIPEDGASVRGKLQNDREVTLLTRFVVYIDLINGVTRFAIPDLGIKINEGRIPQYVYEKHPEELVEGEKWGVIKLCVLPDDDGKKNHIEMVDFKPFKPYRSIDISYLRKARQSFTTDEWIDVLLSAMEYDANGFISIAQKLEFLTRLLVFVEPRLNMIELAPKGTGKSYVFGNLSKYGWLVSGGKVSRAKLFYDKTRQQNGIIKNHDFTAFDEISDIVFQEPTELQAALKSYLESGKTTIDNFEFTSECGLMLMGNIPLDEAQRPVSNKYFSTLPPTFRDTAFLDRMHSFIEGWYLPKLHKGMIYKGWTINVEYFSELLHTLRTENAYGILYEDIVSCEKTASIRDSNAVKRTATAYMKLLFPHWTNVADVNIQEFNDYCLQPAIKRRGIIKNQCHLLDAEFSTQMPIIKVSEYLM